MAALDRRNPNLDDFVGLNWSCWVDRVNVSSSDAGSNVEDSKNGMSRSETMTLRKEDMHIYGHCPAHDDFYLVGCSHCGQVVKPQAFEKHCERWHGSVMKMCGLSPAVAPQQRPCPSRSPSNVSSCIEKQKDGRCHEGAAVSSAVLPGHQHRPAKVHKETVSLSSVKFPEENPALPNHLSSTPHPRVPPWHSAPLPPGDSSCSTSLSERPSVQKPTAGQPTESHCPQRGMRTYSRIYKNINKKECEPNKHCRVLDSERKKLISRELICNTDSIQQQQKALGKHETTEQSAAEQRTTSAGRDMEQLLVKSKHKEKHLEAFEEKITTQGSKYNFNSNCRILRSRNPSASFREEEKNSTVEVDVHPPYPFNQNLLLSEDSEEDEQEEATDLPATPWHPKPLGLCTFGCRTLGCSIFTFDRHLHHLRFALSAMLERHVGTNLWKKMPQVSSGLRSRHVTSSTVGSPVRTRDRSSKSTDSLGLESTSFGQLETKSSQQNSHSTKPPYCTTSVSLGSYRQRNPVGRANKAQLREVALMHDGSAAQKAAKLLHSGKDKSSRYIRDPPLHEKGPPHVASSQGPTSGKKPCPPQPLKPTERQLSELEKCSSLPAPTHRSPRSRATPPGAQQKVLGYDHRGLAQKRKGSTESLLLNSSLSKTSKYTCLSSSSCSSLVSWKGGNIEDVLSWGLEKRSDP
ncbi:ataxin-7-like protein 2b isoform X1 [Embiotoca jacksoni]|uniref:ataxin-7-like protein 2b isoform X1 n=1 Tax=Embiotoca jacksoni TaxID=100190 RepID=UPI003703C05F